MKKNTKTIIGVVIAVLLLATLTVVGGMTYLGITWNGNHEFGQYVIKNGPWGTTDKWFSSDGKSYLECEREADASFSTVTAYFEVDGQWQSYELNVLDCIAYLNTVVDGVTTEGYQGRLKFDGTKFTIYKLDEKIFGNSQYEYFQSHVITEPANTEN